ncbi:hypothetical protein SAY86_015196 [Trapa natans]|uniref:F-box domain-containing protein n=1 Tax=Trapa natans TaxID=22666 RepID=A0AAN7QGN8_TRANT|nr:hypothetical protein SAY86_015196 [Trapa natans]
MPEVPGLTTAAAAGVGNGGSCGGGDGGSGSAFDALSTDLTELILGRLPVPTLLRASAVCKPWRSLISSPAFYSHAGGGGGSPLPWFFLFGLHNTSSRNHQAFGFDPISYSWFSLPTTTTIAGPGKFHDPSSSSLVASSGYLFNTFPCFSFTRLFSPTWRVTSPLHFPRINPLLAVHAYSSSATPCFVVVGGVRFIGNLVDIEDRLAVEIYDPRSDSWDLCPPLPADFNSGNSSQSLSSALFKDQLYIFGIYSSFVSAFDLHSRVWSNVRTLRPPGALFSFLIACKDRLILAGMCLRPTGASFKLWEVEEETMEFSEIAAMPPDLLYSLVDSEDSDDKFASLKCVGSGNLIYVFNEEYHKKYPACMCQLGGSRTEPCSWRRLPTLRSPVNKFHKVISFCSTVSTGDVLHCED